MTTTAQNKPAIKRARKMAREPEGDAPTSAQPAAPGLAAPGVAPQAAPAPADKPRSKAALVLDLLRRDSGATLEQLVAATGWLPHTTRAALTGIKKKGHSLRSDKVDGVRTYRVDSAGALP